MARVRAHPAPVFVATLFVAALFVALKVIYAIRAMQPAANGGIHVIMGSDSLTYLASSRASVLSKAFFEAPGPFGFLLLLKAVARHLRALVVAQTMISIGAWLGLACSVRAAMRTSVARLIGFAGILVTGLAPSFAIYDAAIATESLAISLACIVIALALRLAVRPDRRTVVAFVVAFVLAGFTRDLDAVLGAAVGVTALITLAVPRWRSAHARPLLVGGLTLVLAASGALALSNAARRWYWPTAETLVLRVAADHAGYRWLVQQGMPDDGTVQRLQSNYYVNSRPFAADRPPYRALRRWLDAHERATYTKYLLTHPGYALTKPRGELAKQFAQNMEPVAAVEHIAPDGFTRAVGSVGLPPFRITVVWALLAGVGLGWALLVDGPDRRRIGSTIAGMALLVVPHALAAFHGDALEVARHSLSVALQARVLVWAATAFAIDACVVRHRARRDGAAPSDDVRGSGIGAPALR